MLQVYLSLGDLPCQRQERAMRTAVVLSRRLQQVARRLLVRALPEVFLAAMLSSRVPSLPLGRRCGAIKDVRPSTPFLVFLCSRSDKASQLT